MGGKGNPYRINGRFGSRDNHDSVIYTPMGDMVDTGYGFKGKGTPEFATDAELREYQIEKQKEQADALNRADKERDEKIAWEKIEKDRKKRALQGKIKKLQKSLNDSSLKPFEKDDIRKQIFVLKKRLEDMK